MSRPSKDTYYIDIALAVAKRGTCLRKNYGAVIVKDDIIISTGYTGVPRGYTHCSSCARDELNIPSGERYDLCESVHAEQNAIINAPRSAMLNATMYLAGYDVKTKKHIQGIEPCDLCKRMIINSGIDSVIIEASYGNPLYITYWFARIPVKKWIEQHNTKNMLEEDLRLLDPAWKKLADS